MGHLKIGLTTIFEAILRRLNKASGLNGPRKEVERILTAFQNRLWMWLRAAFHSGVQMVCVEVHHTVLHASRARPRVCVPRPRLVNTFSTEMFNRTACYCPPCSIVAAWCSLREFQTKWNLALLRELLLSAQCCRALPA